MLNPNTIRRSAIALASVGALGLGGAAIAGAAGTGSSSTRPAAEQRQALSSGNAARVEAAALEKVPGATVLRTEAGGPYGTPYHAHIRTSDGALRVVLVNAQFEATAVQTQPDRGKRGHGGGREGTALTGETKEKVEAAVRARYSGATIIRTETNAHGDAPYEAHIRTRDDEDFEVLVSDDFKVVGAEQHPARP